MRTDTEQADVRNFFQQALRKFSNLPKFWAVYN
jgi:hypothetical protein